MILIFSDGVCNKSIDDVKDWINYYHGDCVCINSNTILNNKISISLSDDNGFSFHIKNDETLISLDKVNVIWNWTWYDYGFSDIKLNKNSTVIKKYMYDELNSLYGYLRFFTSNKFWWGEKYVNKLRALYEAQICGLSVPSTHITNSKNELRFYFNKYNNIVMKSISDSIFFNKEGEEFCMYTSKVTEEMIVALPDYFFPMLIQNEIKKDFEVRSFFLNNQFYSAAILSQNDPMTRVDFRNYNLGCPNRIVPYKLPSEIENKLRLLMKKLDLDTGSIDIIYSNNKHYFLEINPVGQFDMISSPCNFLLTKQIAKYLVLKDKE